MKTVLLAVAKKPVPRIELIICQKPCNGKL